jgi:hypothetical protein
VAEAEPLAKARMSTDIGVPCGWFNRFGMTSQENTDEIGIFRVVACPCEFGALYTKNGPSVIESPGQKKARTRRATLGRKYG